MFVKSCTSRDEISVPGNKILHDQHPRTRRINHDPFWNTVEKRKKVKTLTHAWYFIQGGSRLVYHIKIYNMIPAKHFELHMVYPAASNRYLVERKACQSNSLSLYQPGQIATPTIYSIQSDNPYLFMQYFESHKVRIICIVPYFSASPLGGWVMYLQLPKQNTISRLSYKCFKSCLGR